MRKNNPTYSPIAIAMIILNVVVIVYCAGLITYYAYDVISRETTKAPIVLPDDVTDVRLSSTIETDKDDGLCFHLIRRADGQPDYVVGECR